MSLATLIFSGWNWLWLAAGVLAVAFLLLIWSYRAGQAGSVRWVCIGLKLLGVIALALCLLEPLWSGQRVRPGANLMAIVADNSMGLQIKDRGQTRTRGEALADLLGATAKIYSVDKNARSLREQEQAMRAQFPIVNVDYRVGDFAQPLDLRHDAAHLAGIVVDLCEEHADRDDRRDDKVGQRSRQQDDEPLKGRLPVEAIRFAATPCMTNSSGPPIIAICPSTRSVAVRFWFGRA